MPALTHILTPHRLASDQQVAALRALDGLGVDGADRPTLEAALGELLGEFPAESAEGEKRSDDDAQLAVEGEGEGAAIADVGAARGPAATCHMCEYECYFSAVECRDNNKGADDNNKTPTTYFLCANHARARRDADGTDAPAMCLHVYRPVTWLRRVVGAARARGQSSATWTARVKELLGRHVDGGSAPLAEAQALMAEGDRLQERPTYLLTCLLAY